MKNIIDEKPTDELFGRRFYSINFVDDANIKEKKILDIGCGFGWFELNAVSRGARSIIGIELTEKDLETAKKYIDNQKIKFVVGNVLDLPFEKEVFDTIVSFEVVEHIPTGSEDVMFNEVRRVLKNGGAFYLSTPNNSFFAKIFDPAWWMIGHRHYSKKYLIDIAQSNGFAVEKIIVNGGWWEIIGINNLYISKWIFRRRPFFENFFNKKQNKEYEKEKGITNIFIKFRKL